MYLSVRVKLIVPAKSYCSFTVSRVPFSYHPSSGEYVIIDVGDDKFMSRVQSCIHYCTEPPAALVQVEDYNCESYDAMLLMLDKFKSSFPLESFDSSDTAPETYYSFYRNVLKLMNLESDTITAEPSTIKIFAECCRSVLLTEILDDTDELDDVFNLYNPAIKVLHTMVLEMKSASNEVLMLDVIKEWEPLINEDQRIKWDSDFEKYIKVGRAVFSRVGSLDKLPIDL